jgi:hypothetical protein
MTRSIAIIGAGMAGLAAARRLGAAGCSITLFDKSRGVGGRMATRRVETLQFDHGAQYFTARGEAFRALVGEWQGAGQTAEWFDGAFVGTPGMTAPTRAMVGPSTLVTGVQVVGLERQSGGWSVRTADGSVDMVTNGSFSVVILAVPAPQAVPLLASAGVRLHGLDKATYAPCWALMLAFEGHVLDVPYRRLSDGPISWIARNSSKPGRSSSPETVVAHASPDWSRAHLEMAPVEAAAALLAHVRELTGISAEPTYSAAHRWRYAQVEQAAGIPCIWDAEARIGACGDWCLGARIEAAFDSGEAMAAAILASDRKRG